MADSVEPPQSVPSFKGPVVTALSSQNEARTEKVTTFHLYDPKVPASLIQGLTLSTCQLNTAVNEVIEASDETPHDKPDTEVYMVSTKMTCSLCNFNFTSRQQQTDHYKLDWHRFNLKQRIMGAVAVTEEQFDNISGEVSSISGSDSSTDDESDDDSDLNPYSNSISLAPNPPNESAKSKALGCHVKGRKHPKVFFRNTDGQLISLHRCILHGKKNVPTTQRELVSMAMQLPFRRKWVILMIGGGHFAGAIFDGQEVATHKTFHRYTVRAKRGTAQGMRDSQQGGNQPKSAGASLRRHNEAALVEDIHALLTNWQEQIKACYRIFLRAPSYNKNAFFGGKNPPMERRDERIVTIPFATRRPTFKEIQRVHGILSTVECYGDANEAERRIVEAHSPKTRQQKTDDKITGRSKDDGVLKTKDITTSNDKMNNKESDSDSDIEDDVQLVMIEEEISTLNLQEFETNVQKPKRPKKKRKPRKKLEANDDERASTLEGKLSNACKQGDWDQLKLVALSNDSDSNQGLEAVLNRPMDEFDNTLLHVAVQADKLHIVWNLMETGVDPAVKNKKGQLPYVLCNNKELRNEFRRFMAAYPDKFDYERAQIPSPLSLDKEEKKAAKAAEKRRIQKKNKRIREKEQKEDQKRQDEERKKQEAEEDEKRRFAKLSDREKRALAAERRFQTQLAEQGSSTESNTLSNSKRCWLCGTSLMGKVPFEYLDYKFCSIQCVKQHKQQKKTPTT